MLQPRSTRTDTLFPATTLFRSKLPRGNPREENGAIPSPHTSVPTDLTGLPDPGLRFGDEGRSSEGPHGRGSEASTRTTFTTAGGDMTRTTDIHTASDHSLVSAAAGGDAQSLDELPRRRAPIAWRLALAITGRPADAATAVIEGSGATITRSVDSTP